VRDELTNLLGSLRDLLEGDPAGESVTEVHATVTASVPNSVPVRVARRPQL
jgi:hypothetical protein